MCQVTWQARVEEGKCRCSAGEQLMRQSLDNRQMICFDTQLKNVNSNQLWIDEEDLGEVSRSNARRRVTTVMINIGEMKKVYLN